MSNLYASLTAVKANLDKTDTDDDTILLRILEGVSREAETYTDREFYVTTEAREFDSVEGGLLMVPDLLSVSAFATDTEQDGNFDDETWTEGTDFNLLPHNKFPKTRVEVTSFGSYSFSKLKRAVQITGNWGYGNGKSATPYEDSGLTITVADSTTTTGTASAAGIEAGQTLLCGTEQIYVSAVTTDTTLTIERGMNGTTAAAHTAGTTINVYLYPADVTNIVAYRAASLFEQRDSIDVTSEKIGDWSATYAKDSALSDKIFERVLNPYRRLVAV